MTEIYYRYLAQSIIFLTLLIASSTASEVPMSKPNCTYTCGNVTIPYPFGIGTNPDCYLNPYYQITCNRSSFIHRPFLRKFNLEVLKISLDTTDTYITVNNPVYSTCGGTRNTSELLSSDLRGSPFEFSDTNRFMTVGCDNILMVDRKNQVLAGCTSTCVGAQIGFKGCYGINCCQTTIPASLDFYILASILNTSTCTYALVADYKFLTTFSSNISRITSIDHVPATLKWGIQSSGFLGAKGRDNAFFCSVSDGYKFVRCRCGYPYVGNPYIVNGCQLVAVCAKCNGRCQVERVRGFYCIPNRTTEIIIGTLLSFVIKK